MRSYKFTEDSDYHTQRNNEIKPIGACNVTAITMGLAQAGIPLKQLDGYKQPEDGLMSFLSSAKSFARARTLYPWSIDRNKTIIYPPNEIHPMLEWAVNEVYGEGTDLFRTDVSLFEIIGFLLAGYGIVMSGLFPVKGGELNHVVSISGFAYEGDDETSWSEGNEEIAGFYIDDPYGDYMTEYGDHCGNDIFMTKNQFSDIMKPIKSDRKWAHLLKRRNEHA